MKAGLLWTVLAAACFLSACGGDDTAPATPTVCTPGDTKTCVGPGACAGGQICAPDGKSYGSCDCGGAKVDGSISPANDASAGGSAGASGAGGAAGAGGASGAGGVASDASADASDSNAADVPTSDAFCTAQGDGGFTSTYVPAIAGHEGVCTPQQIADYWTACLSGGNKSTCNAFSAVSAQNLACASCILPASTTKFGPIFNVTDSLIDINFAGCMEIVGGAAGLQCAKTFQTADLCEVAACVGDCPVILDGGSSNLSRFSGCRLEAEGTVCASLFNAAQSCGDSLTDAGAAVCFQGQSIVDLYKGVAAVFCGN